MSDVRSKYVPPAIEETAFNCPHCGALAKQFWHRGFAAAFDKDGTPNIMTAAKVADLPLDQVDDPKERAKIERWAEKATTGFAHLHEEMRQVYKSIINLFISQCFNCDNVSIWIYDRLMWPTRGDVPVPNSDLPENVRRDYEEAGSIVDVSPRGAAALLRLAIQQLCVHLGGAGRELNADIAALVATGLDQRVQQALDVVRVVGNNAVHPGQIDLRDDRATAEQMFGLVNLIADIMITQPKQIKSLYDSLPTSSLKAIERRDAKR